MLRFPFRFCIVAFSLALGAAPAVVAQTADTVQVVDASLFDTRIATGHKERRGTSRRAAPRPAPVATPEATRAPVPVATSRGTYESTPLTPGGGRPVASIPPPLVPAPSAQTPATASGATASAPALYDGVPTRPGFFDARIAWGHKEPAQRADPLFDSNVAEGHKELPVAEEAFAAGLFMVPPEAMVYVDAEAALIGRRFNGTRGLQKRYFPAIERALARLSLPSQLKYLALIESGLDPQAVSHAGARGIWQIMPGTAGDFGLDSMAVHEPARATPAATLYLDRLHRMFDGDWLLALAAYNAGPGRVLKAVRDYERIVGERPTYWQMRHRLPRETQDYVPRFLAAVRHFEAGS